MKQTIKQLNRWLLALCLSLVLLTAPVWAADSGSIQVTLTNGPGAQAVVGEGVYLYQVCRGGAEGQWTPPFQDAGLALEGLTEDKNAENAAILYRYALDKGVPAVSAVTDGAGVARFSGLEKGVYLLAGRGEQVSFAPFLVLLPSQIGGNTVYDVACQPKTERLPTDPPGGGPSDPGPDVPTIGPGAPEPEPPGQPGGEEPSQPTIPQTGADLMPVYLLLSAGVILVILGIADLTAKGERRE